MTLLEQFEKDAPGYVAAGAEWLDENEPGWERRMDLASLCLYESCRCVLGQVAPEGYFESTMDRLGFGAVWAEMHGFNIPLHVIRGFEQWSPFYAVLDELWIALVKSRFSTGTLSDLVESEDVQGA